MKEERKEKLDGEAKGAVAPSVLCGGHVRRCVREKRCAAAAGAPRPTSPLHLHVIPSHRAARAVQAALRRGGGEEGRCGAALPRTTGDSTRPCLQSNTGNARPDSTTGHGRQTRRESQSAPPRSTQRTRHGSLGHLLAHPTSRHDGTPAPRPSLASRAPLPRLRVCARAAASLQTGKSCEARGAGRGREETREGKGGTRTAREANIDPVPTHASHKHM